MKRLLSKLNVWQKVWLILSILGLIFVGAAAYEKKPRYSYSILLLSEISDRVESTIVIPMPVYCFDELAPSRRGVLYAIDGQEGQVQSGSELPLPV